MRSRWALAFLAAVTIFLSGGASAAFATDPGKLGSGYVTDAAGMLSSSDAAAVTTRLAQLHGQSGADLYVVFVDSFSNPAGAEDWANKMAEVNSLGAKQYLLAISKDRQFYLSGDVKYGPLSDAQITSIENTIQPLLKNNDYKGAVITAADQIQSKIAGGGEAGSMAPLLGVLLLLVLAALMIWLIVRSRRKKLVPTGGSATAPVDEAPPVSTKDLAKQAASALVATDDAVKTSEQELGFAKAQFGDAAAAEFDTALADAKARLDQAFAFKQQLDDNVPDTEADTRAWNSQIIDLCAGANKELDDKAADFDELRKLEQNAPEALERVQQLRGAAAAGIDAATAALASLTPTYAPEALATIADNPAQARDRIAFADQQLSAAQASIGAGNGAEAAVSLRGAEEAVGQATMLEKAITTLAADLTQGESDAHDMIADLENDLAAAKALPDTSGQLASVIASTQRQVDAAKANLASNAKRPIFMFAALQKANSEIDSTLAAARDAQVTAQRAAQSLNQLMVQAQAQVSAAEDFITSRRGAIGAEARTRVAQAGAALVQAQQLAATDPAQALPLAQRANDLAAQAIQYAQNDVGSFGDGLFGGGQQQSGNGNMMGAVLGGIVINSLLGGRGGGGIFGGGGGGGGGIFGGGGRGGSMGPGSFGGSGTRGRRGGGRF